MTSSGLPNQPSHDPLPPGDYYVIPLMVENRPGGIMQITYQVTRGDKKGQKLILTYDKVDNPKRGGFTDDEKDSLAFGRP
jgi:hypothetical protein